MSASGAMTIVTGAVVAIALALTLIAGGLGHATARDTFLRVAVALGIGGLSLVALFWRLEVRGGVRAGSQSRPEAVRGRRRDHGGW